jgi:repressor LexA
MTPRLMQAFTFIKDYIARHQYSPTVQEIADEMGLKSRGVTYRYVDELKKQGYITLLPGKARNIRLINDNTTAEIPLLGKIAAGLPIQAIRGHETVDIAYTLLGHNRYALRVKGESMIEEGIHDGDLVICEQSDTACNGDVVVALIDDDSATLKRFYLNTDGTVTLRPANAALNDMIYAADRVTIQGLMVGLLRFAERV